MIIKAIYEGTHDMGGYKQGVEYELKLTQLTKPGEVRVEPLRKDPYARVVKYSSFIAFLKNWTNIKPQKEL